VGPAAEVGEVAVRVQGDGLERVGWVGIPGQVFDQLHLVGLVFGSETLERVLHADVFAHERLVGVDVGLHALFDPSEVGVTQRHTLGELEVVVEAVLYRRPDRDLDPGIELEHRFRQDVSGVVADQCQGVLAAAVGQNLKLRVRPVAVREPASQVPQFIIDLDRERSPGQTRADCGRRVGAGRS
jgi:hypothetical protein